MAALIEFLQKGDIESSIDCVIDMMKNDSAQKALECCLKVLSKMGSISNKMSDKLFAYWEDAVLENNLLACVIKICILSHNIEQIEIAKIGVRELRKDVLVFFPKEARLSQAGQVRYKDLIDNGDSEESRIFIERILAGLCAIWTEKRYDDSVLAIDYLSRKKLLFGKLSSVQFLWQALGIFFDGPINTDTINNTYIARRYERFSLTTQTNAIGILVAGGRNLDRASLVKWDMKVIEQYVSFGKNKLKEFRTKQIKNDPDPIAILSQNVTRRSPVVQQQLLTTHTHSHMSESQKTQRQPTQRLQPPIQPTHPQQQQQQQQHQRNNEYKTTGEETKVIDL